MRTEQISVVWLADDITVADALITEHDIITCDPLWSYHCPLWHHHRWHCQHVTRQAPHFPPMQISLTQTLWHYLHHLQRHRSNASIVWAVTTNIYYHLCFFHGYQARYNVFSVFHLPKVISWQTHQKLQARHTFPDLFFFSFWDSGIKKLQARHKFPDLFFVMSFWDPCIKKLQARHTFPDLLFVTSFWDPGIKLCVARQWAQTHIVSVTKWWFLGNHVPNQICVAIQFLVAESDKQLFIAEWRLNWI
jgi:hypothetical protein